MKHCGKCDKDKPLEEFWKNQSMCKECRRAYDRERYQTVYKKRRRESEGAWRNRRIAKIRKLKEETPCADCDTHYHPEAMHFDHLPGSIKLGNICEMAGKVSQEKLDAEMAKCELVCANCHAVRTHIRRSSD